MLKTLYETVYRRLAAGGSIVDMVRSAQAHVTRAPDIYDEISDLANLLSRDEDAATGRVERDLHRWAWRQPWRQVLRAPYQMRIPLRVRGTWHTVPHDHAMLLPHEMVGALYDYDPDSLLFRDLILPSSDELESFWQNARESSPEWYQQCLDNLGVEGDLDVNTTIPLGVHGDDAAFNKKDKLIVLNFNSVLKNRATIDSRLVITCLQYSRMLPMVTLRELYKVISWSFECLARGVWPAANHAGQPLNGWRAAKAGSRIAGPFSFVFSETRGDMKWIQETFQWNSYSHNYCCHLCKAHKKIQRLWYTDVRVDARHRRTLISQTAYMNWTEEGVRSPFCEMGTWHIWRVWLDAMHVLDLGVCQHVAGSMVPVDAFLFVACLCLN